MRWRTAYRCRTSNRPHLGACVTSETPTEPSPARLHIVLLDDEVLLQRALARIGSQYGIHVSLVADDEALLAKLQWTGAEVAVIDFHLAGRTCVELVTQLEDGGVPVVVWTADPNTAIQELGTHTRVVPKSAGPERLFDEARRVRRDATSPLALASGPRET